MAREATITQEAINAAADRIRAAGGRPTARAVREELGQGSMATVLRLLQHWQASQGRAPEAPMMLPVGLQRALLEFIGQEVASAKLVLEQELVSAQQAEKDLIAENEAQTADLEALQTLHDALHAEHSQLEGRYAQLTTDVNEARHTAETHRQAAEAARTEMAKLQLRLEGVPRLEAEIVDLKEGLEAERAARIAADQAAAVAIARLEQTQGAVEDLKSRLVRTEADLREANQEAGKLRGEVSTLQGALESTRQTLRQTQEEARRAEAAAVELRGQLAAAASTGRPRV
ncbi:MAG: DNA-binding protein [Proteobacteria bacterium]|nr:DNA-binding protein [Pseudomonadota bacterium]